MDDSLNRSLFIDRQLGTVTQPSLPEHSFSQGRGFHRQSRSPLRNSF
uniref:Uncharacterized protein n=1 Tax=Anguilla anguilla TaxID=7936 RepID=A0A0E9TFQ4_ANGAN